MVSRPVTMIEVAGSHACAFIGYWLALAPSDRVEPKPRRASIARADMAQIKQRVRRGRTRSRRAIRRRRSRVNCSDGSGRSADYSSQ